MSDWTPTKDSIRNAWSYFRAFTNGPGKYLAEFDRCLEQNDREVAAKALREAANVIGESLDPSAFLQARADLIEGGYLR
jgi:hypothetical protein